LLFFRQQLRFIFGEKLTWRFCLNHKFTKKIKIKDVKMTNGNINQYAHFIKAFSATLNDTIKKKESQKQYRRNKGKN